jgi:3-oxoacyl-[acyl-carrier protein] reductase
MSTLKGKVAIVTGASKGIGAAIAEHLAAAGAAVVVNYGSSKEGADRVVAEITRQGGTAVAVQANVANQADVERLFSETKRAFGRLDFLVNNAGIYEFFPIEDVTEEHFHKHFDLNVLGLLLASKEAARHFDAAGGSIINISSAASTLAPPNTSVYSATKAAVVGFTQAMHKELGSQGIKSTALWPAFVDTPMTDFVKEHVKPEEMIQVSDIAETVRVLLKMSPGCVVPEIQFLRASESF